MKLDYRNDNKKIDCIILSLLGIAFLVGTIVIDEISTFNSDHWGLFISTSVALLYILGRILTSRTRLQNILFEENASFITFTTLLGLYLFFFSMALYSFSSATKELPAGCGDTIYIIAFFILPLGLLIKALSAILYKQQILKKHNGKEIKESLTLCSIVIFLNLAYLAIMIAGGVFFILSRNGDASGIC